MRWRGRYGRRAGSASARATALTVSCALALGACALPPAGGPEVQPPGPSADDSSSANGSVADRVEAPRAFFVEGRSYGTDVYGGPLDVVFNKGLAVAQWGNKSRAVFTHDYAWSAVWASVRNPGPAVERGGGWGKVLRRHMLPLAGDELREGQWIPNYFGHVLEGGLAYRRLLEWNRAHGVPLPTLVAIVTTQFAVALNEAYETPPDDPWVNEHGTAGAFLDFAFFDPVGMALFHQDGVSRFFAEKLGAQLWPTQASVVAPDGLLVNNGQAAIFRPALWFTDRARLFIRTGMGLEAGLSVPRSDGLEVAVGMGFQSTKRFLDPVTHVERAEFAGSAGLWIDRGGSLLFSITVDQRTDRRVGVNLYPGVVRIFGSSPGAWFVLDDEGRVYLGLTTYANLGVGFGVGF